LTGPLENGIKLGILNKLLGNFNLAAQVRFLPGIDSVGGVMTQENLEPVPKRPFPF
jgi:hypothetical protein